MVETLREGKEREESKERREGVGERRERGVGKREKEDKTLQKSREILSMDTGPFHSNIHGIHPFQLNNVLYQIEMCISVLIAESMK